MPSDPRGAVLVVDTIATTAWGAESFADLHPVGHLSALKFDKLSADPIWSRNMKISEESSQKIKNLSLICAALVISIHVGWPHASMSFNWLIDELVKKNLARIAVPFA